MWVVVFILVNVMLYPTLDARAISSSDKGTLGIVISIDSFAIFLGQLLLFHRLCSLYEIHNEMIDSHSSAACQLSLNSLSRKGLFDVLADNVQRCMVK